MVGQISYDGVGLWALQLAPFSPSSQKSKLCLCYSPPFTPYKERRKIAEVRWGLEHINAEIRWRASDNSRQLHGRVNGLTHS